MIILYYIYIYIYIYEYIITSNVRRTPNVGSRLGFLRSWTPGKVSCMNSSTTTTTTTNNNNNNHRNNNHNDNHNDPGPRGRSRA